MSNYYEVLGISRDASPEGTKETCRERTRQLYPDVAGPNHEGEFKEVSSAYEVLSDADKHQVCDLSGKDAVWGGNEFGDGFAGADFDDLDGIFQSFFGRGAASRGPAPRARRGQDALMAVDAELFDAAFGATRLVPTDTCVTCTTCDGFCCAPGTKLVICSQCNGVGNV